jgi:hypothetical protein
MGGHKMFYFSTGFEVPVGMIEHPNGPLWLKMGFDYGTSEHA